MKLNLLPNVAKFQADKIRFSKKIMSLVTYMFVVWVMGGALVMSLYWINRTRFLKSESKYKTLESDYMSMSGNVVINQVLRQKAKLISQILADRFEYGKTFVKMENLFEKNVTVKNMELKDRYSFLMTGVVSDGKLMDMVENRVNEINQGLVDGFLEAKLTTVSVDKNIWTFDMEVVLK